MRQYYCQNVKEFVGEDDCLPARTFSAAVDWLMKCADRGPFLLQVESFDVHEPFHVPAPYASMYMAGIEGTSADYNIWPPYQVYADLEAFMAQTTPGELGFLKAQYCGKTSLVDTWLGRFMGTPDTLGLWDDTMVIFTTDLGHDLGERGLLAKQYPHRDSHADIPLFIWHPRRPGTGRRVPALIQTVDLFSTIIAAAGGEASSGNSAFRKPASTR